VTLQRETFEEWRERTAAAGRSRMVAGAGVIGAAVLYAGVHEVWWLWFVIIPAAVVWTVVDGILTRRRLVSRRDESSVY
jgi:hypothetical protein